MTDNGDEIFFDTNVLVYAYDFREPEKRLKAKHLVEQVFSGDVAGVVSNQVLAEFFYNLNKFANKQLGKEAAEIVEAILSSPRWRKINYNSSTVKNAATSVRANQTRFWDQLIAQTMLENGIRTIYTENTRDFDKMGWLKVINPFK